MGSCCTSRVDADGKTKTGASASKTGKVETKSGGAAVKFNPMDKVKNTIRDALRDSK